MPCRYNGCFFLYVPGPVAQAVNKPVRMQDDNSLTAIGKALVLVGKYLRGGTLLQAGSSQAVRLWAVLPPGSGLTLIALNKALAATQQGITLSGCGGELRNATVAWQLSGTAYTDSNPTLVQPVNVSVAITDGQMQLLLPPTSITVLSLA